MSSYPEDPNPKPGKCNILLCKRVARFGSEEKQDLVRCADHKEKGMYYNWIAVKIVPRVTWVSMTLEEDKKQRSEIKVTTQDVIWSETEHPNFTLESRDTIDGLMSVSSHLPVQLLELVAQGIPTPSEYVTESTIHGRRWLLNNKEHRINKPAFISTNKISKEWFFYGLRHREDGPARILYNKMFGRIEKWYNYGELHREDGPAVFHHNTGRKEWHINGKWLRLEE